MKVTVLGSGAAYGVPMIFNTWGKADSSNPKNYRTRASILIEDNEKNILIDCGPDFREQINKNNVKNIDSVLITHGHYDHIMGIPELPRAAKLLGHGIDVYASLETMAEIKRCFGYLFQDKAEAEPDSKSINWKILPDEGNFTVQGMEFATSQLPHHSMRSSAFRYRNFAYVTDWQDMPSQTEKMLQNLDVLIIECNNGLEQAENGHSDISGVKKLIEKIKPKRTLLTHLSVRVDDKKLKTEFDLAYDGQVLTL